MPVTLTVTSALGGEYWLASSWIDGIAIATRISTGTRVQITSSVVLWVLREGVDFALRRGFEIPAGARLVVVEDIVSTGKSLKECLAVVRQYPGEILGAACLIDRSGGRADLGVPLLALATVDYPAYPADALPPELAALPAVKPGSRKVAA